MEPCEDYDLYLRLARRFPAACHHEVVSEYRQHGASTSRNAAIMLAAALSAVDAQRPLVGRNTWYHRAIEAGVHAWRRYYGQQVMEDVAERMANGEWQEAAKDMAVLLRYYPHGFKESLKSVAQALPSLLSQRGRDAGAMLPGPSAPLVVRSLSPAQTAAGVGFNLQPSGLSGLAIEAEHANPWTVAIMGTTPLRTVYNSASSLSALVPPELLEHAGSYQIYLEDGGRVSKPLEFTVKSFGVPVLKGLRPTGTRARIGFNIQPDGQSALAVEADSAAPDTLILFGETPLVTTYHDPSFLTALVPQALYAHPGTYPVSLHNQSGTSQPIHFTVQAR
jgi:hypothetical protein